MIYRRIVPSPRSSPADRTRVSENMASRRYTILIADRTSGVVRRVTISARPAVAVACAMVTLPVLIGVGAAWKAKSDVGGLYASQQALELENASFRTATSELSGQIESLQSAITDLGAQAALDPSLARTIEKLPALVKSRAMGGNVTPAETTKQQESTYARTLSALSIRKTPSACSGRCSRASNRVCSRFAATSKSGMRWPMPRHRFGRRQAGSRRDRPAHHRVTGGSDYHAGLDIAGDKGQPVYATAAGVVTQAGYSGGYGNLIVVDHGFGLRLATVTSPASTCRRART